MNKFSNYSGTHWLQRARSQLRNYNLLRVPQHRTSNEYDIDLQWNLRRIDFNNERAVFRQLLKAFDHFEILNTQRINLCLSSIIYSRVERGNEVHVFNRLDQ